MARSLASVAKRSGNRLRTLAGRLGSVAAQVLPLLALAFWARSASAQAPLSVIGAVSPRQGSYVGTFTFSATASGGDAASTRYAFFRRRPGGIWTPDINAPAWQAGNSYNWSPSLSDVGVWETYVWVKDANTPPTMNTYGYAAGHNSQPIEVFGPPTVPGPTSASCAYSSGSECWVTGDFVISVSPSSGGLGSLVYHICRSNDTTGWGGCDVHLTMSGGTSITVSGSHLPADGYRRAYYFQAKDSEGAYSGWNSPLFVKIDRYAPTVSASNASSLWFSNRTATISASDAHSGLQAVRYSWNSPLNGSCTTGTSTSPGATLTAPAGDNVLYVCASDNTGRVGQWSGSYRVSPLGLAASIAPSRASYLASFTWTASASGGTPSSTRFAYFHRRPGGTWIPDVNNPTWTASTTSTWTPTLADVGIWETYVWVKDGDTPASMSGGYGYAAGVNTMPIEVVGKPTVPGATTVACAYATGDDCWVTGDFTASVTASTGGMGSLVYDICRSVDSAGGFAGCDATITLTGGTSILVSGTHLPADGYRRAYYFQAKDAAGAASGWNAQRYVRVDRYAPAVGASNASDSWFPSRTATISASDATVSAAANSGVQAVRYAWNGALDAACSTGTATSSGATLTAPAGDNLLYLCAKDNTGRVAQWNGRYRVSAPLGLSGSVTPSRGSYLDTFTWTMTATGGDPATIRYAFFRRIPNGTWIPDVNNPIWQTSNVYTWTPGLANVGTWETYVWVKDANTPANMNGYGYAAGLNTMPIEVVGKPTVPGPTTVACAYSAGDDCWVTGDFTASVTASAGGMGSLVYDICRSVDSPGGFAGCDATITLTGGSSILVSGTHLAGDGFRRAYYFQAKDSAGAASGWNAPRYVRVDRNAPTASATNASDLVFSSRTATISASDAAGGAGANSGLQAVRYSWGTALDAGCTNGTATTSGTILTAPPGDNLLYLCAKDNTGRIAQWNGRYRVTPITLSGAVNPTRGSYLDTFTWTMSASGGDPATLRYAFFRRRPGGLWIPDVTTPNWQASNVYTWTPGLANVGTWETYVWTKDGNTPANANSYGYAAGLNTGPVEVVGPPTLPGATTVACAYATADDCWVAGDFTASVAAATGGMGNTLYQICRSVDSTGGFAGCDVNLTLNGGTSIAVSGAHLPADGFRRAYYFQAKDSSGALSGWNAPRYVRVDRYAPTVGASNASDQWFASREATVSASDGAGGTGSNSGLLEVRYNWNSAPNATCTTGTTTAAGATLTAPTGDNLLYLCARDRVGRVAQWSGQYRVQAVPAPQVTTVAPKVVRLGAETTLTVTGTQLQGASVYIATAPLEDSGTISFAEGFPTAELVSVNPEGTVLTVRIDARDPSVVPGWQNLVVDTPGGTAAGQFRLVGTEPIVDVYTPSQPVQGNIHLLVLGGANLQGAEVVPLDPAVKVLDLDNSDDNATMGLLYVNSDAELGTYEVRVQRPGGESITLSLEVVGSASAASIQTTQLQVPGQSQSFGAPELLLQEPVAPPLLFAGPGGPGIPGGPGGLETNLAAPVQPNSICFYLQGRETWTASAILLALTDLTGNPVTREVLNRLHPGEKINFNSLTTAAIAYVQTELLFQVCPWGTSEIRACIRGGAAYLVPLVGGHSATFDFCTGSGGNHYELTAGRSSLSKQEWTSSNGCLTITDDDPESRSGRRSGEASASCCSPSNLNVSIAGNAFDTDFEVGGKVFSIVPQGCTNPNDCTKTIEWNYVKADGTEGPAQTGPVELFATPDERKARIKASFLPERGTFEGSSWEGSDLVTTAAGSTSGSTAQVMVTAGGESGNGTLNSPTYRWENLECRAPVQVSVSNVEIELNLTSASNDDMVELKNGRRIRGRVRLPASTESDVAVVLTNPDGRLRFPEAADVTKSLSLPKNGGWAEFELSGEVGSDQKDDAEIEVHQGLAEGAILGHRTATVFYFDPSEIKVTPGGSYSLIPLSGGQVSFAATGTEAVAFQSSATLKPSGLDCSAPPLTDLHIGILQNATAERWAYYDQPTITCLPGNSGRRRTVPASRAVRTRLAGMVNDSNSADAPLYSKQSQALVPLGCAGAGTATSVDTPQLEINLDLPIPPSSPGGVPEGTVTYHFQRATMADDFRAWSVIFNSTTNAVTPLRETEWYLHVDSAATTAQRAVSIGIDRVTTNSQVLAAPFFNDEIRCNQLGDPGCHNKTTFSAGSVTLECQ